LARPLAVASWRAKRPYQELLMSTPAPVSPLTLALWPGQPPQERGLAEAEARIERGGVTRISHVAQPRLEIYLPSQGQRSDSMVMICPGGGYTILAIDLEGEEIARWLNSLGIAAAVLTYRVPERSGRQRWEAPLEDAQRAMSLLRSRANEWGVATDRIGILGFSAGGHLAATTSTRSAQRHYLPIDAVDSVSCRPDFTVLVYPAFIAQGITLQPEVTVDGATPPVFLAMTSDDQHHAEGCIAYYLACRAAGIAAEMHLYQQGGHGYGLRPQAGVCASWNHRAGDWLALRGLTAPSALPKPG
jgi:acetyl esterase/lipase